MSASPRALKIRKTVDTVEYILTYVGDWKRSRRRIPRCVGCFPVLLSIWAIAWYVCFAIMRNLRGNLHFTPWVNVYLLILVMPMGVGTRWARDLIKFSSSRTSTYCFSSWISP